MTKTGSTETLSVLFQSVRFFLERLAGAGLEAAIGCFSTTHQTVFSPREREEYNQAKCQVVLRVLQLAAGLLSNHPNEALTVSLSTELDLTSSGALPGWKVVCVCE